MLHGHADGIDDVVSFVSETLEGLEHEFRISVDDYLTWCADLGQEPVQPDPAIGGSRDVRIV